ncbi:sulfurtransferase TusA [Acinetobacter baumannii]|nr:sulfurtransferase TusA [Acinetobacter baumannii]EHU1536544.1 sulfurtransferase TusA [Acinetobacter baumannii]EHU1999158.1 sulfurtransferase TusA [Acinetobacter baumannii]
MSEQPISPTVQLNTRGLSCPEPVMMLHQAIRKAKSGDVVEVLATDPSTSWDIPKFCMHLGHELLLKEEVLDEQNHKEYRYLVQKG